MKNAKTIALSTFFLGIFSACADQELKIAGLSCFIPDHWVAGENSPESEEEGGKEYKCLSYFSSKPNEEGHLSEEKKSRPKAEQQGRLNVTIGTKSYSPIFPTAERLKKGIDIIYSDWEFITRRQYLGKKMVGGGVLTRADLVQPSCQIVDHDGRKVVRTEEISPRPTPEGLVTLNASITLQYIDHNSWRFLSIYGPKELMDLNRDQVSKIMGSFKIQEEEQGGAGQPATRSEADSEGGDKPQPESEGRSR